MTRKMKSILLISILFFCSFFLTGCWDYRELNNVAIVTGIAVDKEDDEYQVTVLIAKSKQAQDSSTQGEAQNIVYQGKGKSMMEGISEINSISPKEAYIGHLSVVVMSEEVAREGILDIADFLMRSPQSRKRFHFIISKDAKAGDVLKILSPLESFPSQNIANNLQTTSKIQAAAIDVLYSKFLSDVITPGISPVLPVITIDGSVKEGSSEENLKQSNPKTTLKLEPNAIFRNDKLVGFASDEEARAINLINNQVVLNNVSIPCDGTNAVIRISASQASRDLSFENGEAVIHLNVNETGYITEINCDRDLSDMKVIDEFEKQVTKNIEEALYEAIDALQNKYQSDVLGIGNMIYKHNPKYWKKVSKDWDTNEFRNLKIKVNVKFGLNAKGSLEQTIRRMYDESKN